MEIKRFDMPMVEYHVGDKVYRQAVLTDEKLEEVLDILAPVLNLDIEKLGEAKDLSGIADQVVAFFREVKGITELKNILLTDIEGRVIDEPVPIEVLLEAVSDFLVLNENWIKRLKSFLIPFSKTVATQVRSRTGQKRKSGSMPGSQKTRSTTKG